MRRNIVLFIAIFIFMIPLTPIYGLEQDNKCYVTINNPKLSQELCEEGLYKDLFITAIAPDIQNAIDQYYQKYMQKHNIDHVGFDTASVDVLKVERIYGNDIYPYIVKLSVMPFIGPHNVLGNDIITIKLGNLQNNVKIIDIQHVN